jgi:acyl-CoA synthetase (AMP-forming)/AMP-acid ligase II
LIDFLFERFNANKTNEAIVWKDKSYSYEWLMHRIEHWEHIIQSNQVKPGTVTILEADFTPNSIALYLALIEKRCILVPLTSSVEAKKPEFIETAQGEVSFAIGKDDKVDISKLGYSADHEYYQILRRKNHPGLILFSSGSTGKSKAAVHDFVKLLEKFKKPRHSLRTITFLLYDHIGGVNTLFYTLSNGGCVLTVDDRNPDSVLNTIEKYRAELLPTSPTFINLILLSEAYKRYDLSSLKLITYGTEPMPESTLKRIHEILPNVKLQQTYGLSELGILRSKSKDSRSLWVKVGGEGFKTKIVDDILWIKAESAMLGYLNAPSPFDEDGWFNTEDAVEVDGDYIRILGRKSELINIGGEKVYPIEVESVLKMMTGVEDVTVSGESNPLTGQIVRALVKLDSDETVSEFRKRMYLYCKDKLPNYKIPQKVVIQTEDMYGERFKKIRQR